jgi:hypothetical protein
LAWKNSVERKNFREEVGKSAYVAHLLPETLTEAGFWFLLQAYRITATFHPYQWMSKFVTSSEWMMEDYAEFLKIEGGPLEKNEQDDLSFYDITLLQMIWADEIHFSKIVDTLTSYLLDLIACAYRQKPDLIPSKARFDLNFVRRFRTINDAVRGSAVAELERISRSGFSEIFAEAKTNFRALRAAAIRSPGSQEMFSVSDFLWPFSTASRPTATVFKLATASPTSRMNCVKAKDIVSFFSWALSGIEPALPAFIFWFSTNRQACYRYTTALVPLYRA